MVEQVCREEGGCAEDGFHCYRDAVEKQSREEAADTSADAPKADGLGKTGAEVGERDSPERLRSAARSFWAKPLESCCHATRYFVAASPDLVAFSTESRGTGWASQTSRNAPCVAKMFHWPENLATGGRKGHLHGALGRSNCLFLPRTPPASVAPVVRTVR